ncbi:MAG: outer membrane lipoprotein-sorting protein, partial [Candidatus Neomarinimicrobiota bacterium]
MIIPSRVRRIPLVAVLLLGTLSAQSGEDIARLIDARAEPVDQTSDLTMILTSRSGSQRTLTVRSVSKGGTRQIVWFLAPADDRGVAFLRIEHEDRDDEMRMWLPSFRKMRRIAASRKGESFMGSDLSYEDMTSRTLTDYTYELRGEERLHDQPVWVLASTPRAELRSSYSELVSWVRKSDAVILKEEYYDRVGNLLKVRTVEVEERQGYVVPVSMFMRNVQKEHTTELHFDKVALDTGVSDDLFHERNLRRLP